MVLSKYHNRKYERLPEELEHVCNLKGGKQGVLGILEDEHNNKYVYKLSQYLNYTIEQEYNVIEGLNNTSSYIPNFVKTYGKFYCKINDKFKKNKNPFYIGKEDNSIWAVVLLMELLDGLKLYRYIKNETMPNEINLSLVKQVLLACLVANKKINFTHYDLHTNNIIVRKCPLNSVYLYILPDGSKYLVPTYGFLPTIIDFGFSYNDNCKQRPLYSSLAHTDVGFLTCKEDNHSDFKLFLTSVSYEMDTYRPKKINNIFRKLIKSVYSETKVDLVNGWDLELDNTSISTKLYRRVRTHFKKSKFFFSQGEFIIDLMQSLVFLPIKKYENKNEYSMDTHFSNIVGEFSKIEKTCKTEFNCMYIFKEMLYSVNRNKKEYYEEQTRNQAVSFFKADVKKKIRDLIPPLGAPPIDLNWEKLLCSLICVSRYISNFLYERLNKLVEKKKENYLGILFKQEKEIYEYIDINLPSHFMFDENTTIYVWDSINECNKTVIVKDLVDDMSLKHFTTLLNNYEPSDRGTVLYDIIEDRDL
jgi:hypothetical protein